MPGRELLAEVEKRVSLDEWELERYASDGSPRWRTHLIFYTVGLVKSGYLVKRKGTWYLTTEGEKVLALGASGLLQASIDGFEAWKKQQPKTEASEEEVPVAKNDVEQPELALEEMEEKAKGGIINYINNKNPYEFQNLCAALLRGMGYYTPFVAPKGRDGGIDIIAYRDPLGTVAPRIRVQVKHREQNATPAEIRELVGVTKSDGDVGIFISSGGFTNEARNAARNSSTHIELIDLNRFIDLWTDFYPKMNDEDKNLLPLLPVYFLAPTE